MFCVSFCDTGCGMTEIVRERLFEPFFTTKEVARDWDGPRRRPRDREAASRLDGVESAVDQGSTFRVYLPKCPAQPDMPRAPNAGFAAISRSGTST